MKSIISNEKKCIVCETTINLERHHIFAGSYRKKSEKFGAWVWLCHYHHQGEGRTGYNNPLPYLDGKLKDMAKEKLVEQYGQEWFIKNFKDWRHNNE